MSEVSHIAAMIFRRGANAGRVIVAVAGPPAAGKSTIAEEIVAILPEGSAAVVPMDGVHYDDRVLDQIGWRQRKGAPETFDLDGYESLLKRLRAADADVAIPVFDRSMELSRGSAAIVPRTTKFIITEGNYLLLDEEAWSKVRPLLNHCWYLTADRHTRIERLLHRHLRGGRDDIAARAKVHDSDMANADLVEGTAKRADLVLRERDSHYFID